MIKRIILIFLATYLPTYPAEIDWKLWYGERTEQVNSAMKLPVQERIPILAPLIWIGPRELENSQQEHLRVEIFLKAQNALLSTPGHAEYFDKRIREPYEEFKNPPSKRYTNASGRYLHEVGRGVKTLEHLPSPETIKVLGEMLSEEWVTSYTPGPGETKIPSLASCAYYPLSHLPLVEPPTPPNYLQLAEQDQLKIWQAWYAEIKSGKRTFAFKGEPREYRFKPDGTWDTIPISLPAWEEKPKVQISKPLKPPINAPTPSEDKTWIWLAGCLVAFMALLGWKFRKKG